MKKKNTPNLDEPFYTLWGKFELAEARTLGVSLAVVAALLLVVIMQQVSMKEKDRHIRFLSSQRIMLGFADENGVFRSADKLPNEFIYRYASEFVSNLYNFSPKTISGNLEKARDMMDYGIALKYTSDFEDRIKTAHENSLSQHFVIFRHRIIETQTGYKVLIRGQLSKYAARQHLSTYNIEVTVPLKKLQPQAKRPEGLAVLEPTDRRI